MKRHGSAPWSLGAHIRIQSSLRRGGARNWISSAGSSLFTDALYVATGVSSCHFFVLEALGHLNVGTSCKSILKREGWQHDEADAFFPSEIHPPASEGWGGRHGSV